MKPDPTIGDIISSVRSAPRRLLDVRVSTIWQGFALGIRLLLLTIAYVVIVLVMGEALKYWWHVPRFYYLFAFVVAPLSYIREWWRDRKAEQ